jgi:hypothetical protein
MGPLQVDIGPLDMDGLCIYNIYNIFLLVLGAWLKW